MGNMNFRSMRSVAAAASLLALVLMIPACRRQEPEQPNPEADKPLAKVETPESNPEVEKPKGKGETPKQLTVEEKVALLILDIKKGDIPAKHKAVCELAEIRDAAAANPVLLDALKETHHIGLGQHAGKNADTYNSLRESVVWAMLRMGPKAEEELIQSGVPLLMEGLKDPDPGVREHTARALALMGPKAAPAFDALVDRLGDENAIARRAVSTALMRLEEAAAPALVKGLQSKDRSLRKEAARILNGMYRAKIPVEPLIKALGDEDPVVRYYVVGVIGFRGPEMKLAAPLLVKLLGDKELAQAGEEKEGHAEVLRALVRIGVDAVPPLIDALEDKDILVSSQAAEALGKIGPPAKSALPALRKCFQASDLRIVLPAASSLVLLGDNPEEPVSIMAEVLGYKKYPLARYLACCALQRVGKKAVGALPALINALEDEYVEIRGKAVEVLGNLGEEGRKAAPALIRLLDDPDFRVSREAGRALKAIGPDESAVPALVNVFFRESGKISPSAGSDCLVKLGPRAKAAAKPLTDRLKTATGEGAVDILHVLRAIGPDAKEAVPVIIPLLSTPTEVVEKDKPVGPSVRYAAMQTLASFGPAAAPAIPRLLVSLREEEAPGMRSQAARTLVEIGGDKEVLEALQQALKDPEISTRAWVAAALIRLTGKSENRLSYLLAPLQAEKAHYFDRESTLEALLWLGPPATRAAIPELHAIIKKAPSFRQVILGLQVIGTIGPDARIMVPDLLPHLKSQSSHERQLTVIALGWIGSDASAALDAIRLLADDKDEDVAQAVTVALKLIQNQP